jgi:hypothetical protein
MNEAQYSKARNLRAAMAVARLNLEDVSEEKNTMDLPADMFERHLLEKKTFFTDELQRLQEEFEAL